MSHYPVGWFEIYVNEIERAKKFYAEVFQKGAFEEFTVANETICSFPFIEGATNSNGALVKSDELAPGVGGSRVYFTCEDCAVEVGRVEAAGGKVISPKHSIGEFGFTAVVEDTEGNYIGLHSRA